MKRTLGNLLVALQFLLLAALLAVAARGAPWSPLAVVTALAGIALGLGAVWFNRPGNFNIHPEPRAGAVLVRAGPYRWIRHPMYSALLLFGAACALAAGGAVGWALWIALAATLNAKAALEERWMAATHAGYAEYRAVTRRFVPFLF